LSSFSRYFSSAQPNDTSASGKYEAKVRNDGRDWHVTGLHQEGDHVGIVQEILFHLVLEVGASLQLLLQTLDFLWMRLTEEVSTWAFVAE
jgi:hypothetical protein